MTHAPSAISRAAAVCLYAALMTHVSVGLIGAHSALLIEGRFAASETFVRALAARCRLPRFLSDYVDGSSCAK
jgi:hypothetical protein